MCRNRLKRVGLGVFPRWEERQGLSNEFYFGYPTVIIGAMFVHNFCF